VFEKEGLKVKQFNSLFTTDKYDVHMFGVSNINFSSVYLVIICIGFFFVNAIYIYIHTYMYKLI
jgi:hypothetical protein